MINPTFEYLAELKKENRKNYIIYANYTNPHPNPYFYKYYYRIFTENSTWNIQNFLTQIIS